MKGNGYEQVKAIESIKQWIYMFEQGTISASECLKQIEVISITERKG